MSDTSYEEAFSFLLYADKGSKHRRLDALSVRSLKQLLHMNAYRNMDFISSSFCDFAFTSFASSSSRSDPHMNSSVLIKLTNSLQFCQHRHLSNLQKTFSFIACCN